MMTEQQKATTADAESLLQRASDLCIEIVRRGPYAMDNAANLRNDIDRYLSQVRHEAAIRPTPQPADVPQARPAQEDAPVADEAIRVLLTAARAWVKSPNVGSAEWHAAEQLGDAIDNALSAAPVVDGKATDTPASAVAEPVATVANCCAKTMNGEPMYLIVAKHALADGAPLYAAPPPVARSDAAPVAQNLY